VGKLMISKGRPGVLKLMSGVDSGASHASEWEMLLLSPPPPGWRGDDIGIAHHLSKLTRTVWLSLLFVSLAPFFLCSLWYSTHMYKPY